MLSKLNTKFTSLFAILLMLAACVSLPVQEMSDARQAIRSAERAGAAVYAPKQLQKAKQMLEKAQTSLETGAYFEARRFALEARDKAIQAREKTMGEEPIH
jgi:predicted S18 family serine protease